MYCCANVRMDRMYGQAIGLETFPPPIQQNSCCAVQGRQRWERRKKRKTRCKNKSKSAVCVRLYTTIVRHQRRSGTARTLHVLHFPSIAQHELLARAVLAKYPRHGSVDVCRGCQATLRCNKLLSRSTIRPLLLLRRTRTGSTTDQLPHPRRRQTG